MVICDGKSLNKINNNNYGKVVLILNGESPVAYIKKGITRFIFDFDNIYELCVAMHTSKHFAAVYDSNGCNFLYKGEKIFISKAQREMLKSVLVDGRKKGSSYRAMICRLRKKFGREFLI